MILKNTKTGQELRFGSSEEVIKFYKKHEDEDLFALIPESKDEEKQIEKKEIIKTPVKDRLLKKVNNK